VKKLTIRSNVPGTAELPHIFEHELDGQICFRRARRACSTRNDVRSTAVTTKPCFTSATACRPWTTTEIEHLATADAGEPEDLLDLFLGDRKCGFREVGKLEIFPDRFVGAPFAAA
jgi:hypothetical protein